MEKFRPLKNTFFKAISKKNNETGTGKKLFNPQYILVQKLAKKNKLQNKTRKNKEINADEEAEEGEALFTIGENVNLCTQYEKKNQYGSFSKE